MGVAISKGEVFRGVCDVCHRDEHWLARPLLLKRLAIQTFGLSNSLKIVISQGVSGDTEVEEMIGFVDPISVVKRTIKLALKLSTERFQRT
jgi:hypothetical protein